MKNPQTLIRFFSALFFMTAPLLLPSVLFASAGGGHEPMSMEAILWDMGIKVLNVSVLGFFAFKYLAKPLNRYVDSRAEKVRRELEEAKSGRREAEEQLQAFKEKASQLDDEIEKLRKDTCSDIDKEQKLLLEEAREAAEHLRQHARDSIRQEVVKAREDLHSEAARLAVQLAEELVTKNINPQDHDRLVSEYLKEMEAAK